MTPTRPDWLTQVLCLLLAGALVVVGAYVWLWHEAHRPVSDERRMDAGGRWHE